MHRWALNFAVSLAVLAGGLMISPPVSSAKPDYMKREKKTCVYCHNAPNKDSLNEIGKCYAEHGHSLEKCDPVKKTGRDKPSNFAFR